VLSKLKKYQNLDIRSLIDQSIRDNEKTILTLNQDQMYEKGVMDVDSPSHREHYAKGTVYQKKKKARYKKTDFVTLKWDGDFYSTMKIIHFNDRFVIAADDFKWANWLEPNDRFGKALGLTDKSKSILRDIVRTDILRRIRNAV